VRGRDGCALRAIDVCFVSEALLKNDTLENG
jgi:hypothetical protein